MMNRKKSLLIAFVWTSIALAFKFIKPFKIDSPIFPAISGLIFCVHVYYVNGYKKNKLERRKNEIKASRLKRLKLDLSKNQASLAISSLPFELKVYYPIIQKWGIENVHLRVDLYDNASKEELLELKLIEEKIEFIENWIEKNPQLILEVNSMKLTLKAYNDLGLWTWS